MKPYLSQGVNQAGGLLQMWVVRDGETDLFTAIGFFARWRCRLWALAHGYGWLRVVRP